jgi:hypothetical protein
MAETKEMKEVPAQVGKPLHGFPWPEAAKARLQAHPFQRRCEAMSASLCSADALAPPQRSHLVEKTRERQEKQEPENQNRAWVMLAELKSSCI